MSNARYFEGSSTNLSFSNASYLERHKSESLVKSTIRRRVWLSTFERGKGAFSTSGRSRSPSKNSIIVLNSMAIATGTLTSSPSEVINVTILVGLEDELPP
ncbi:hypothetical protein ACB098_11G020900 [Castanea mollissima]